MSLPVPVKGKSCEAQRERRVVTSMADVAESSTVRNRDVPAPLAEFAPVAPSAFRRLDSGEFECDAALGRLVVLYLRPYKFLQEEPPKELQDDCRVGALPQAVREWVQWGRERCLDRVMRHPLPSWYTYDAQSAGNGGIDGWIMWPALLVFKDGAMVGLEQLHPCPYAPGSRPEHTVETTTLHTLIWTVLRHMDTREVEGEESEGDGDP